MKLDQATRTLRQRRAAQKREGIVVLIVMLVLTMATGTALFAVQSSQYEQRSSSAVGEANWARGLAECTAMAGMAYAENELLFGARQPPPLAVQWTPSGAPAEYTVKYGLPEPASASPGALNPDIATSFPLVQAPQAFAQVAQAVGNAPGGNLGVFLPTERGPTSATYPLLQNYDSQFLPVNGLHYFGSHWLQESLKATSTSGSTSTSVTNVRTRTVITGFAEVRVWGDPQDSSLVRELHELDAISRGYIDTISPLP